MALDYPHPPSSAHSHPHGDEDSDANATTRGSVDTAEKARWMVMGEVSLAEIARKTIGYLPRHLKALCTHAAGAAIRRHALGKTLSGSHAVERTAQEACYLQSPHPDATLPLACRVLIGALDFEKALTQVHCCCVCVGEVQSLT